MTCLTCEAFDESCTCLLVKTLGVALLTDADRDLQDSTKILQDQQHAADTALAPGTVEYSQNPAGAA